MGDLADFAIEEVMVCEAMRHSYYTRSEMSNEEAFDIGFIDPLGAETGYLTGERRSKKSSYKKTVSQLISSTEKYDARVSHTKWMMNGFKDFYLKRGFLSAKQKAIIDTNFNGGSDSFIMIIDMKNKVKDSEKAFLDECAARQGKTPEQAEEDDRRFWLGESDE